MKEQGWVRCQMALSSDGKTMVQKGRLEAKDVDVIFGKMILCWMLELVCWKLPMRIRNFLALLH